MRRPSSPRCVSRGALTRRYYARSEERYSHSVCARISPDLHVALSLDACCNQLQVNCLCESYPETRELAFRRTCTPRLDSTRAETDGAGAGFLEKRPAIDLINPEFRASDEFVKSILPYDVRTRRTRQRFLVLVRRSASRSGLCHQGAVRKVQFELPFHKTQYRDQRTVAFRFAPAHPGAGYTLHRTMAAC